jgi:mannitol-1-phosphate 5-dehydrogenase
LAGKGSFVQFGAGNIGRSFVGQLFARAGYEVVFVDVVPEVVEALNRERRYRVEIRDRNPQTIWVEGVRAVDGRDAQAVIAELKACRLCATSVGPKALPHLFGNLARALQERVATGAPPLDMILAENLRDAANLVREGLRPLLPEGFPLHESLGLVETSIGKMVPIMPEEVRRQDPLLVYAEAYNTLICDRLGFRNPVPDVPGLDARENMVAYVDRKSFIHNFGHALCAYFAHLEAPELVTTWEAVEHRTLGPAIRAGMWESARALAAEYPSEFTEQALGEHIEDLLGRFANRALGDTLYRVGRDVARKLSREDRVIGPLLLQAKHGAPGTMTALCAAAGMRFAARDEHGQPFAPDAELVARLRKEGPEPLLREVCGLDPEADKAAWESILAANEALASRTTYGGSIFTDAQSAWV